jgi:acylphosphatase
LLTAKNNIHGSKRGAKTAARARAALVRSGVCGPRAKLSVREEISSRRYYVSGMVQGVGFRYFVHRAARDLKLSGYVRNLRDGRVEVYAVAEKSSLHQLRRELERGPSGAYVSGVTEEEAPVDSQFSQTFSIEDDA